MEFDLVLTENTKTAFVDFIMQKKINIKKLEIEFSKLKA